MMALIPHMTTDILKLVYFADFIPLCLTDLSAVEIQQMQQVLTTKNKIIIIHSINIGNKHDLYVPTLKLPITRKVCVHNSLPFNMRIFNCDKEVQASVERFLIAHSSNYMAEFFQLKVHM